MNTDNLFIADPFNEKHRELFNEFENINDNNKPVTTYLEGISKAYDKTAFTNIEKNSIVQNTICFSMNKDNTINDYCYIKAEKDRKVCELFFAHLNSSKRNRIIMQKASNYALNVIGMEQVFVSITPEESNLYNQLASNGYEDIGEVNGKITLIKEKEEKIEMSKMI